MTVEVTHTVIALLVMPNGVLFPAAQGGIWGREGGPG